MINLTHVEQDLNPVTKSIDVIFVPQGAEYQAVCRGLNFKSPQKPTVIAIPMGCQSLNSYLQQWKHSTDFLLKQPKNILLMGLCGGLSANYNVGDLVMYSGCSYSDESDNLLWQECDRFLIELLQDRLKEKATIVKGFTSNCLIELALQKQNLYQQYHMDVVDMEGFIVLKCLTEIGIKVAMIRVISDEAKQDLPNLASAISGDGTLKPLPLAISMIQKPIAAIRLIQGSLKGLRVLQQLTHQLFG